MCLYSTCIGAQDPYCGWDVVMKKCTSLEESLSMTQWEQSISACPVSARLLHPLKMLPTGVMLPWRSSATLSAPFSYENLFCKPSLCSLRSLDSWLARGHMECYYRLFVCLKRNVFRENCVDLIMEFMVSVLFLDFFPLQSLVWTILPLRALIKQELPHP